MEALSTAPTPCSIQPAVIHWPRDAERRSELARAGVPCLLVVASGAEVPPVGRGEDWVPFGADEREVAARLSQLAAVGRRPEAAVPPVLPASMAGAARRIVEVLAAVPGELVPTRELEAAVSAPRTGRPRALAPIVAQARRALLPLGWSIDPVPTVGYVLVEVERR